jgi:hypothetical protein
MSSAAGLEDDGSQRIRLITRASPGKWTGLTILAPLGSASCDRPVSVSINDGHASIVQGTRKDWTVAGAVASEPAG